MQLYKMLSFLCYIIVSEVKLLKRQDSHVSGIKVLSCVHPKKGYTGGDL